MSGDLYLGADAGGTGVKYVLTDGEGSVLHRGEVATDPTDPDCSLHRLADALDPEVSPRAVGLACAGIVDPVMGTLGRSPNLPGWEGADLGGALRRVFGDLPSALVNDVNGALYGEFRRGAGRGCRDLVMIALGTGVGGGVMIDGKLLQGAHHGAGEIGHMILERQGPACTCGSRGCLEAYAGSVGLIRQARVTAADPKQVSEAFLARITERGEDLTPRNLADLAEAGDITARALFAEAGDRLGQAVGNLVNVLDPEKVILGGGVAAAGDLLLTPCRRRVESVVLAAEARKVPIVMAELGPHAAAVGAACLARETE